MALLSSKNLAVLPQTPLFTEYWAKWVIFPPLNFIDGHVFFHNTIILSALGGLEGTDGGAESCGVKVCSPPLPVWLTAIMILCSNDLVSQGPDVISLHAYPGPSTIPISSLGGA